MNKIAIDIVLLPDYGSERICREINSELSDKKIDFNASRKNPHISLMMGLIEKENIPLLKENIKNLFRQEKNIELLANLEKGSISQTKETIWYYEINEKYIPKTFFEKLLPIREKFLSYENISTSHFFHPTEVESISTAWVKGFSERNVHEYSSHITLGIGNLNKGEYANTILFQANKIAVFQLGNYCTCENKLFEMNLK